MGTGEEEDDVLQLQADPNVPELLADGESQRESRARKGGEDEMVTIRRAHLVISMCSKNIIYCFCWRIF